MTMKTKIATWPTCPAGPCFPEIPLASPILRVVPGSPRDALAPLDWLGAPALATDPVLVANQAGESARIPLPTDLIIPPHWFDFQYIRSVPESYISFSIVHPSDRISGNPYHHTIATGILLLADVPTQGVYTLPLISPLGIPIARLRLTVQLVTEHDACLKMHAIRNKRPFVPRFTGHRGMGSSGQHAPWRPLENTPTSYLHAAFSNPEITAIELDVQPTADNKAVVFHDWVFRPRDEFARPVYNPDSVRIPLHGLTLAQFDELYRQSYPTAEAPFFPKLDSGFNDKHPRLQADECGVPRDAWDVKARTLGDMCAILPKQIGILVELKYPPPNVQEALKLPYPSKDDFVNCVLDDLMSSKAIETRNIAFLCFEPDVCEMLSLKQQSFPVYLSHSEILDKPCDEDDPRCVYLEEGSRFVSTRGLDGIMMFNKLIETKPDVIADLVHRQVPILTYGTRNSDAQFVQRQFDTGVGGVIVDDVHAMWHALTGTL